MTDVLDQQAFRYSSAAEPDLLCEEVPLSELAQEFGTPLYVYSKRQIIENFHSFDATLKSSGKEHYVSYAVKANSNIELLRILAEEGSGADVVSAGELLAALAAGFAPEKITFDGTGKTDEEIELALRANIHAFNVESFEELAVINSIAERLGQAAGHAVRAKVSIRVNPDVDAKSHPYISTGMKENKFGIEMENAREAFMYASRHPALEVVGIHVHIGSQITSLDPFIKAARSTVKFVNSLRVKSGIVLEHLNFGGGQGIHYRNVVRHPLLPKDEFGEEGEYVPSLSEFVGAVLPILDQTGLKIIFEPGRAIVANACALLASVLYTKENSVKKFVITDTGMTELIRPCLYEAYHQVAPLKLLSGATQKVDIVGPICETSDFLAQSREMPSLKRGDAIAVLCAGAYGYALASNYNLRPRAAEVLVDGTDYRLIRERERIEEVAGISKAPVTLPNSSSRF